MYSSKDYHQHTDYHLEPAGLRRLDFFVRMIERWIADHPGVTPAILDVGCGNGNIAIPLASRGWWVHGIDADIPSILAARERNTFSTARFSTFSFEALPAAERYDIIIASEVIEHVTNPQTFLVKAHRHLNVGGMLLGSIPFGYSVEELLRRVLQHTAWGRATKARLRRSVLRHEIVQSHAASPHLHFFTWRAFAGLLEGAGFHILNRQNTSILFKEFYYIFGRLLMRRGTRLFHMLDTIDHALAAHLPLFCGDGWMFIAARE